MKKVSLLLVAALIASAQLFAEEPVWKFYFSIVSNSEVKAVVLDDYSFSVAVPAAGAIVDPAQATISVGMQNVASLGVSGKREHSTTVTTGAAHGSVDLSNWISNVYAFEGASIEGLMVQGTKEQGFVFNLDSIKDGVITGTTVTEDTRAAWQLFTGNFVSATKADEDSYILIKKDTWFQYGNEKLTFTGDVSLFEGSWTMDKEFEKLVKNTKIDTLPITGEETYKVALSVAEGCKLAVGQSTLTSGVACKLDVDLSNAYVATDKEYVIGKILKNAKDKKIADVIKGLVDELNTVVGDVDLAETVQVKVTLEEAEPTGYENTSATVAPVKQFRNGQLVIVKDGCTYNAVGAQIR